MNAAQAAARLGVHETQVTQVREHEAGWLVSLRTGAVWLVTDQVARVYVPEVDDPAPETTADPKREPKKAAKPVKKATKKAAPRAT